MARVLNFKHEALQKMVCWINEKQYVAVKWSPCTREMLKQILEWLDSDEAQGEAFILDDEVLFTDSNTAFDFRMRFG